MARPQNGMALIGRRQLRSHNSTTHNLPSLMKGRERCTLEVSRGDAERLKLRDKGRALVKSRVGCVEASVEVTDDLMPGVVSLPHGWGHDTEESTMTVAKRHPGTNINALTDNDTYDEASGTSVLVGIPVTVEPVL